MLNQLIESSEWLTELIGADWVRGVLKERAEYLENVGKGIENLVQVPVFHPIVDYLAKIPHWRKEIENGHALPEEMLQFLYIARVLKKAISIQGGQCFVQDLVANRVRARLKKTSVAREFWDQFFEAETAVALSAERPQLIRFGPPYGNPDLELQIQLDCRPGQGDRVWSPIECWRSARAVEGTDAADRVWQQLVTELVRSMRLSGILLKVNVRAHRAPVQADVPILVERVWKLAKAAPEPEEPGRPSTWVTSSEIEKAFQISVGLVGKIGMTLNTSHIDNEFFDISAEPGCAILTKTTIDEKGDSHWIDPCVVGFHEDCDPRWNVRHILAGAKAKGRQLAHFNATDSSIHIPGGVALRISPLHPSQLLQLDEKIRAWLSNTSQIGFVMLLWTEADNVDLSLPFDPLIMVRRYFIVNENFQSTATITDTRATVFGSQTSSTVVDPNTGQLTNNVVPEFEILEPEQMPNEWPPRQNEEKDWAPDWRAYQVGVVIPLTEDFWKNPGDILLLSKRLGESELRLVRDRFLNLRSIRLGHGRLRDHIAMDLRAFVGALRLFVVLAWDEKTWRLGVGTTPENAVYGEAPRNKHD